MSLNHKIKLLADASLPGIATAFPPPFVLSFYADNKIDKKMLQSQDILLCRSTLKVDQPLLADSTLKIVATASSGSDHIDKEYLNKKDIKLIDAKGSNAKAVADYILAALAYLDLEKGCSGKKIGVIGMGAVGSLVASQLKALGFTILSYDPWLPAFQNIAIAELFDCDILTVHAELQERQPYPSKYLLNKDFFAELKSNTVIINAARGALVQEIDLLKANPALIYCTDVYEQEPNLNRQVVQRATLATPHIAGHSIEAKQRAVYCVSDLIHQVLGLKPPLYPSLGLENPPVRLKPNTWQEVVLAHYNPLLETLALKKAQDISKAFIELRKAHCRHELNLTIVERN